MTQKYNQDEFLKGYAQDGLGSQFKKRGELNFGEACRYAKTSPAELKRQLERRSLPHAYRCGRIFVTKADLDSWEGSSNFPHDDRIMHEQRNRKYRATKNHAS